MKVGIGWKINLKIYLKVPTKRLYINEALDNVARQELNHLLEKEAASSKGGQSS
jgi:hypothetical protein